jgi:hypothetical protein
MPGCEEQSQQGGEAPPVADRWRGKADRERDCGLVCGCVGSAAQSRVAETSRQRGSGKPTRARMGIGRAASKRVKKLASDRRGAVSLGSLGWVR